MTRGFQPLNSLLLDDLSLYIESTLSQHPNDRIDFQVYNLMCCVLKIHIYDYNIIY